MQTLSLNQMSTTVGGADVVDIIDGTCAVVGVAGIFGAPIAAPALAFCAGWGLGRWLGS